MTKEQLEGLRECLPQEYPKRSNWLSVIKNNGGKSTSRKRKKFANKPHRWSSRFNEV